MYMLGTGGKDGDIVKDCIIKDIDSDFRYMYSSSNSIINSAFDIGGVPFLLWVWYFDSKVPCYSLS